MTEMTPSEARAKTAGIRRVRFRRLGLLGALLLLAGLSALRIADPPPLERLRLALFDSYLLDYQPTAAAADAIVAIDIDEESLARYGQWPWPRALLGRLADHAAASGAKVLAFDMIFAEPCSL